jgi:hypothetical protein
VGEKVIEREAPWAVLRRGKAAATAARFVFKADAGKWQKGAQLELSEPPAPWDDDTVPPLIVSASQPWSDTAALAEHLRESAALARTRQRPCFFVSACGWRANTWHDGPLAVITAAGLFSDYLPSGGAAELVLTAPPREAGVSEQRALALELDDPGSRGLRCLRGAFRDRRGEWPRCWTITEFSPREAIALALLRLASPATALTVTGPVPPNWKRLTEHLGIDVTLKPAVSLPLDNAARLVPQDMTAHLARALNRTSAVIPDSLLPF